RQLEPGLRERSRELVGVLVEATRDLFISWVEAQRQVRRQHRRSNLLRSIVGVRDGACPGAALRCPLIRSCRTLGQLPVVLEQILEEVVAPLRRRAGPRDLDAAGDRVGALAADVAAFPAEALQLHGGAFRLGANIGRGPSAMGLAERMPAGDE